MTTTASTASPLGFYGGVDVVKDGYIPIAFTIIGGSQYRGFVTYNGSTTAYVWAISADRYTVCVTYLKI